LATLSIEQFFTGKTLEIPARQRDYAWTTNNIGDLFEDIKEAMELGGGHHLGTFILSQTGKMTPLRVVDGQQRLTTLTMLLNALVNAVDELPIKEHSHNTYITHPVIQGLAAKNTDTNLAFSKDAILACSMELAGFSVKKWPLTEADLAE
jgi:hypothetical protein